MEVLVSSFACQANYIHSTLKISYESIYQLYKPTVIGNSEPFRTVCGPCIVNWNDYKVDHALPTIDHFSVIDIF